MDKKIIHDHFSRTANVWKDQIYKPKNQQRAFEYFDKQYRFDYVTEMIPQAGGSSLQSAVKLTVFMIDLTSFPTVNEVFKEYFHEKPPSRSTIEVSALPMGARIAIEAVGFME